MFEESKRAPQQKNNHILGEPPVYIEAQRERVKQPSGLHPKISQNEI
jgi:hypothetical protein